MALSSLVFTHSRVCFRVFFFLFLFFRISFLASVNCVHFHPLIFFTGGFRKGECWLSAYNSNGRKLPCHQPCTSFRRSGSQQKTAPWSQKEKVRKSPGLQQQQQQLAPAHRVTHRTVTPAPSPLRITTPRKARPVKVLTAMHKATVVTTLQPTPKPSVAPTSAPSSAPCTCVAFKQLENGSL